MIQRVVHVVVQDMKGSEVAVVVEKDYTEAMWCLPFNADYQLTVLYHTHALNLIDVLHLRSVRTLKSY